MQRLKKSFTWAAGVAVVLAVLAPLSAAQAEMKIAVVKFQKLFSESPQAAASNAALTNEFRQRQRDLEQMAKDFKAKAEKFQRDSSIMAEGERNKMQRELADAQRDIQRREAELKEDFEVRKNEEIQKVQRVLVDEVQSFAKTQGFDLVLSDDTVLFRKDAIDITSQVVGLMHEKTSKSAAPSTTPAVKP